LRSKGTDLYPCMHQCSALFLVSCQYSHSITHCRRSTPTAEYPFNLIASDYSNVPWRFFSARRYFKNSRYRSLLALQGRLTLLAPCQDFSRLPPVHIIARDPKLFSKQGKVPEKFLGLNRPSKRALLAADHSRTTPQIQFAFQSQPSPRLASGDDSLYWRCHCECLFCWWRPS